MLIYDGKNELATATVPSKKIWTPYLYILSAERRASMNMREVDKAEFRAFKERQPVMLLAGYELSDIIQIYQDGKFDLNFLPFMIDQLVNGKSGIPCNDLWRKLWAKCQSG